MGLFNIPIGLVPRATTIRGCVTISVIATVLGRLVFLGSLVMGNNIICGKVFTALNSDVNTLHIKNCLHAVHMTESSSFGVSLYEECSWNEERDYKFKEEIINDISQGEFDEGGQLYCHGQGRRDKRLYIASLTTKENIFKEYDPNEDKPYKTIGTVRTLEQLEHWTEGDSFSLFSENEKKRIYCGDGTSYDLKSSRALPIGLWLVLFVMPFLLLTVLSNVTDLCFLMRHPSVLLFGNISHFQIAPHNICFSCCSDVKCHTMSACFTTLNVLISVLGMVLATIATYDWDVTLGGLEANNSLEAYLWAYAGYIAPMVPMIGLGMSLRFVCIGCCFPYKPAYSEYTNSLHYLKDNQLLNNDDPCLTMTVRSRGMEMTATLPPL